MSGNRHAVVVKRTAQILLYLGLVSCGSSGDGPTGNVGDPSIGLTLSQSAASIQQGSTGTVTATITRAGNFTGAVDLSLEGAPAGITGSFSPASLSGATTSSTLTMTVAATAAATTSAMTVRARGTGVTDRTATMALTVALAPAGTPAFTMTLSPAALTISPSASATTTVAIAKSGGFTGAVALAASGAPTGITLAFGTPAASGDVPTIVTVGSGVAPGTYPVTITGTATGLTNRTATLTVTVPAAAGTYTLTVSPTAMSVQQGGSATSTVTITRQNNFAETITVTLEGSPSGLSASFGSGTTNGAVTTYVLTLTASAATPVGTSTLTVRGSGVGATDRTATIALTVTQAPSNSGNVIYQFCPANAPLWFAAQDGAGAWTRVTGDANNKYTFAIASGKGGVAYTQALTAGNNQTVIQYGTTAELTDNGKSFCPAAGSSKTVTGSVAGLAAGGSAFISIGGAAGSASASSPSFTIKNVNDGPVDLIASSLSGGTLPTASKIIIRRGVNTTTLPVLDFGAAEAFAPATATATVANVGTDFVQVSASYFTALGIPGGPFFSEGTGGTGDGAHTVYGVPASQQLSTDLHAVTAIAFAANATGISSLRFLSQWNRDLANRTLTLGANLSTPTVTVLASTPYARLRMQWTALAEYSSYHTAQYTQQLGANTRAMIVNASAAYLGTPATIDLSIPDFSAVAGWSNAYGLQAGTAVSWTGTSSGYTTGNATATAPVEGLVVKAAGRFGTITP